MGPKAPLGPTGFKRSTQHPVIVTALYIYELEMCIVELRTFMKWKSLIKKDVGA